jgi:predicted nucleotidyltransferase
MTQLPAEIRVLTERLKKLRAAGVIKVALLYGSFATGSQHARSDIDLALAMESSPLELELMGELLMATDRELSILRLDDPDESPWVVQSALKGVHLVDPDWATYYAIADRALHESESLRFRRELKNA